MFGMGATGIAVAHAVISNSNRRSAGFGNGYSNNSDPKPKSKIKNFIKNVFTIIIFICFILFTVWANYSMITDVNTKETHFSGVVLDKKVTYQQHAENILLINFDKYGTYAVDVDESTFMTSNKGDKINFNSTPFRLLNRGNPESIIIQTIALSIDLTLILFLLVSFFMWLYSNED